ncbi:MAG: hypothetical protein AAF714_11835 [Pseudomonadota bacterium]
MEQTSRRARRAWAAARRRHMKPGRIVIAEFQHDPDCAIYTPARLCNCNPHRVLKDETGRILARVEGVGHFDPTELLEVVP